MSEETLAAKKAFDYLIQYLNTETKDLSQEIDLQQIAINYIKKAEGPILIGISGDDLKVKKIIPYFQDAAAELCGMGVLRYGPQGYNPHSVLGNMFSLTKQGRKWIKQDSDNPLLYSFNHFSEYFSRFDDLFGEGYRQRSQEACRCFTARCYLASCVMSGAAAESILLFLAIKKGKPEEEALALYRTGGGLKKLKDFLSGKLNQKDKEKFEIFHELIKYQRDDAAHGEIKDILAFDAYESLSRLIFLCQHVRDRLL